MRNAYPEKAMLEYRRTQVPMADVIDYMKITPAPVEARRMAYIMFRNESANGQSGVNHNYVGAQADGARWPARWDNQIAGIVRTPENGTGLARLFLAFYTWKTSVDLLVAEVIERGMFVGAVDVPDPVALELKYLREWVYGNPHAEPTPQQAEGFASMYAQAMALFPVAAVTASAQPGTTATDTGITTADNLNTAELDRIKDAG